MRNMSSRIADLVKEISGISAERLRELEENVELSRAYHDGRTTAARRSYEKHKTLDNLIRQLRTEIHLIEGDGHATG